MLCGGLCSGPDSGAAFTPGQLPESHSHAAALGSVKDTAASRASDAAGKPSDGAAGATDKDQLRSISFNKGAAPGAVAVAAPGGSIIAAARKLLPSFGNPTPSPASPANAAKNRDGPPAVSPRRDEDPWGSFR
jgi:hypothetical protein